MSSTLDKLFSFLDAHKELRSNVVPMVASENTSSPFVRSLLTSDVGNRYYIEKDGQGWDYPCQEEIKKLVWNTQEKVSEIFGGSYAEISPLSGSQCVAGIILGYTKPGDCVFGIGENEGGHWALRELSKRFGVSFFPIPFDWNCQQIKYRELNSMIKEYKPKFIMLDASHTLFPVDVEEFKNNIPQSQRTFYDVSHTLGLLKAEGYKNPLEYGFDGIHGSTHKSFPGPQKGIVILREYSETLNSSFHPILASNIHLHHILSLLGTLCEFEEFGQGYGTDTISNARYFAEELLEMDVEVMFPEKSYTGTHQLWLKVQNQTSGSLLFAKFQEAGILLNFVKFPFGLGYGFRLGLAELMRLGYDKSDLKEIACAFHEILCKNDVISAKNIISQVSKKERTLKYCFNNKVILDDIIWKR